MLIPRTVKTMLVAAMLIAAMLAPALTSAQQSPPAKAPAGPPLSGFTAMRVAIVPVQTWRADSVGWSRSVNWAQLRMSVDSAIGAVLQERGLGSRWAYPSDVVRTAKRNPTYATDPYSLGVGRWRTTPPKVQDQMPAILADNLRPLTAIGDTRFALIPVELRAVGENLVLRLVLVDARGRSVIWGGDLLSPGGAQMVGTLANRVADLVIEP